MKTKEMTDRIFDKIFDNIGMSQHHVDIEHNAEIIDCSVSNNIIELDIEENGTIQTFELIVKDITTNN